MIRRDGGVAQFRPKYLFLMGIWDTLPIASAAAGQALSGMRYWIYGGSGRP